MAEKEEGRVHHPHKRNTYSNRGHPHPGQNRLYNQLGVKDLRELLDRKRSERGHLNEPCVPPPDPSYNYLKDPLRENDDTNPPEQQPRPNIPRKYHNKNNVKREREPYGGNSYPKNKDIENPVNITVEFSTSTGEHVYKMDETTILPTIKHVPDRLPPQNRPFRGRGRGRGRGQQRTYQTRTIRNNQRTPKNSEQTTEELQPVMAKTEENWDEELNENKNFENTEEQHLTEVEGEDSLEVAVQNLNIEEDKPEIVNEDKPEEEIQEKKEE